MYVIYAWFCVCVCVYVQKIGLSKKRFKQWSANEIIENLPLVLQHGLTIIRECRITMTTRVGGFFTVKEVFDFKERFDKLDSDGSGEIDLSEFVANFPDAFGRGIHATRMFREIDKDHSGEITFGELMGVIYPISSARVREMVAGWVLNVTIDEGYIKTLGELFKALKIFLGRTNDVPREYILALLSKFYTNKMRLHL